MTKNSILANAFLISLAANSAQALPLKVNDGSPFTLSNTQIDYDPVNQVLKMRTGNTEPVILCADLSAATTGPAVDLITPSGIMDLANYTRFQGFSNIEYVPGSTTVTIEHTALECFSIDSSSTTAIAPWVPPPEPPVITLNGNDPGNTVSQNVNQGATYTVTLGVTTTQTPVTWTISTAPSLGSASINAGTGELQYTAPATAGTDSLQVTVTDSQAATDTLTINFNIVDPSGDTIFADAFEGGVNKVLSKAANNSKTTSGTFATDVALSVATCTSNDAQGSPAWNRPGDGQSFCYQITVSNNGSQDLSNVHVRELFPLDYSPTPTQGYSVYGDIGEALAANDIFTCSGTACPSTPDRWATVIANLPVGESITLERVRTIHIYQSSPDALVFYAAAFVASDQDTSNNALRVSVAQNAPPSIADPDGSGDGETTVIMDEDGSPTAFSLATLTATDPENDAISWSIATNASNGGASVDSLGNVSYIPNLNYNNDSGTPDSFVIQADDGFGGLATLTIKVVVNPVNDAPEAVDSSVTTAESQTYTFAATDFGFSDVDGDSLAQVRVDSLPATGSLQYNATPVSAGLVVNAADLGNLTYVPPFQANGTPLASYDFSVSDGIVFSAMPATLSINVTSVNDAPTAADGSFTINEDSSKNGFAVSEFGYNDLDGDPMAYLFIYTLPNNGTLTLNGNPVAQGALIPVADLGNLAYTPPANANGNPYDSFTFLVHDGTDYSNQVHTMSINVTPVPDAPAIVDANLTAYGSSYNWTVSSTTTTLDLDVSDPDQGDTANWNISLQASSGSASVDASTGVITFNATGMNAGDSTSFEVTVTDGDGLTDTLTLNVTVNTPPTITDGNSVPMGASYNWNVNTANNANTLQLGAIDPDAGDSVSWSISSLPASGSAVIDSSGLITFDATSMNVNDTTSFTVQATDIIGDTASLTINVTAAAK